MQMRATRFHRTTVLHYLIVAGLPFVCQLNAATSLVSGWNSPPQQAKLRAYWWWLNGNVTKEAITRDLEEMAAKGFGGALICDADGSSQDGNDRAPRGPVFASAEWRELYKHTLHEAQRLDLEMSLNIQSGWNLGGPMVPAEDAPKKLVWTETRVRGGTRIEMRLAQPTGRNNFYRDLFVLAVPSKDESLQKVRPIQNLKEKALLTPLKPFSAPDSTPLFQELPEQAGEHQAMAKDVLNLSDKMTGEGLLAWDAPPGHWDILRLGYTLNDHCRVSTCSEGWDGYAIDPFDDGALKRYWDAVVEPLLADAGPLAGTTLKYLHTDSWEVEVANWTPTLREEFKTRRGYDLLHWLPVITGKILNSRDESNRFLNDFRRTMGDLAIDNHYKLFKQGARRHNMFIHPESGGPHAVPIDAQQCLGYNDAPMSEFWAWSWRHRVGDQNRFFVKQPASAAHVYGHKLVLAEGFTTIGPHWQETLWDNLKPSFDHACTEGLNLLVWHAFVCSPQSAGMPGQQYFAGTHLNPNVTWWTKSAPFFSYINRCQWMLQQGLFVADVAYYYGDHVPNFAQLRQSDPAKAGPGYDFDIVTAEALINRFTVRNGRFVLPDGMSYELLVLPNRRVISVEALRKIAKLVRAGGSIVGPRPEAANSLAGFPENDAEVARLAEDLWGKPGHGTVCRKVGKGKVFTGVTARQALEMGHLAPDFDYTTGPGLGLTYAHRRTETTDIYFVSNRSNTTFSAECTFRVTGRQPELWDPASGERQVAKAWRQDSGRTIVPLTFQSCGSWFVVFERRSDRNSGAAASNDGCFAGHGAVHGPWQVRFDPQWGGPGEVLFERLENWKTRAEPGIKYYSGTATYTARFNAPSLTENKSLWLDLGMVREVAEIKVNGRSCGIVWTPPFRGDITSAVKEGDNLLEVEVVNFWPNRIIGDAQRPEAERITKTNIRKLTSDDQLMDSGLFGPVTLLETDQ